MTVIVEYRVLEGHVADFTALLAKHWPTLCDLGLATSTPPQYFIGEEVAGKPVPIVEIFAWSSPAAPGVAHTHPAVSKIWERMAELSDGDGRPRNLALRPLTVG